MLIASRIREDLIKRNWPDILRLAASAVGGTVPPSELLRKLAAYSPQNDWALSLREVGWIERTLFILYRIGDDAMQRRVQLGLNEGEAHHALKRAIALGRRGEIIAKLVPAGSPPDPQLLTQVLLLGWEHILLTGEYCWND